MRRPGAEGGGRASGLDPIEPLCSPDRTPTDLNDTVWWQVSGKRDISERASLMKRLADHRAKFALVLRRRLIRAEARGIGSCRHRLKREQGVQALVVDVTASGLGG